MSEPRLRPLEPDDVATIAAFMAHPSLIGRRGLENDRTTARSVASLAKAIEELLDTDTGEAWAVDADGVIGLAAADWWWDAMSPWAHVVIDPQHQRRGHGTAAVRLIFDHFFLDTPAGLVQFGVPGWDDAGLAFAASLGTLQTGRKRRAGIHDGAYFDEVEFVMPRATWEMDRAARR